MFVASTARACTASVGIFGVSPRSFCRSSRRQVMLPVTWGRSSPKRICVSQVLSPASIFRDAFCDRDLIDAGDHGSLETRRPLNAYAPGSASSQRARSRTELVLATRVPLRWGIVLWESSPFTSSARFFISTLTLSGEVSSAGIGARIRKDGTKCHPIVAPPEASAALGLAVAGSISEGRRSADRCANSDWVAGRDN